MYKVKIRTFVLLILLIYSCKSENEKFVEYWLSKKLNLHFDKEAYWVDMDSNITYKSTDSITPNFYIVSYIDAKSCHTCLEDLALWSDFILNHNLKPENFIFIVNINDLRPYQKYLKSWMVDYPIFIDLKSQFVKVNNLSKHRMLNTFLIDTNKNILLVGNPLLNTEITTLYLNEIESIRQ